MAITHGRRSDVTEARIIKREIANVIYLYLEGQWVLIPVAGKI